MVGLTQNLIMAKTKADNLERVRNLNLWGQDISDVSILQDLLNVEVLSLSVNRIASLHFFAYCTKLQELYLRKNDVSNLQEVNALRACKRLRVLWLSENPCAEHAHYRAYVIAQLPSLMKLDNEDVTDEERAAAESWWAAHGQKPDEAAYGSPVPSRRPETPRSSQNLAQERPMRYSEPEEYSERGPFGRSPSKCVPNTAYPASEEPSAIDAQFSAMGEHQQLHRHPTGPRPPEQAAYLQHPVARRSSSEDIRQHPRQHKSSNILYAIMALLKDLDHESLHIVRAELDNMLDPA